MKITTMSKSIVINTQDYKGENMNNFVKLVDDILGNMEYIRLLLEEGHKYVTPLHTFDLVVRKLNKLKVMLEDNILTPEQIVEAVKILEKPLKREKPYYVEVENPIESGDPLEYSGL